MCLLKPLTTIDVKQADFSIHSAKSPGHNWYNSGFFKQNWILIDPEISEAMLEFFQDAKLLKDLNHTMLVLFAKTERPQNAQEYRPIACCTVIYKIISKMLCEIFKEVLPKLVDKNQGAFIQGRFILHNVLLSQELMRG